MVTIVNTPTERESSGLGIILGVLLLVLFALLFVVYGLPYLRNRGTAPATDSANINIQLPSSVTPSATDNPTTNPQ